MPVLRWVCQAADSEDGVGEHEALHHAEELARHRVHYIDVVLIAGEQKASSVPHVALPPCILLDLFE
jgi:hypothetical protein